MLSDDGNPAAVTLCSVSPVQVQVTVPPAWIVTVAGEKRLLSLRLTAADNGRAAGGAVGVETTGGDAGAPPSDALVGLGTVVDRGSTVADVPSGVEAGAPASV